MSTASNKNAAKKANIFKAENIVACLRPLKEAADRRAAEKREADKRAGIVADGGKTKERWYASVLTFHMNDKRAGNNGTSWFPITLKIGDVCGAPNMRIYDEVHVGQIMPDSDDELARLVTENKNSKRTFSKRDKGVSLQFNKWNARLALEEDGITFRKGEDGKPLLPGDDALSTYFMAVYLLDDAFQIEMRSLIDSRRIISEAEFKMRDTDEDGNSAPLPPGTIVAPNITVVSKIQTRVSLRATKNQGRMLPNPIARTEVKFVKDTGEALAKFYDKSKPFTADGRKGYEEFRVDGQPVTANNIHRAIASGTRIDGIMVWDSVCFSNMGISIPGKADILVLERPTKHSHTVDNLYDEDGLEVSTGGSNAPVAAAQSVVADEYKTDEDGDAVIGNGDDTVDVVPRAASPLTEEDYSSLIDTIGATTIAAAPAPAAKKQAAAATTAAAAKPAPTSAAKPATAAAKQAAVKRT